MKYVVKKKRLGRQKYHFTVVGDNGEVIAQSENYANHADALHAVHLLVVGAAQGVVEEKF